MYFQQGEFGMRRLILGAVGIAAVFLAGLRVDESAAVINCAGEKIAGLYACGEMVGGLFSAGYPGGSGLT
jgi:tricarballylate dehydrogenase